MALPLAVLATGSAVLLRNWSADAELRRDAHQAFAALRAHLPIAFVATATLTAAAVLAIVAVHSLAD
jgi:hypothetical protein